MAEFGESFVGKGFVLNESLPRPLRELSGFDVCRCIKEHDHSTVRQRLDKRSHKVELGFRQIIQSMENDTTKLLEPRHRPFNNSCCCEQTAILRVNKSALAKSLIVLFKYLPKQRRASPSEIEGADPRTFQLSNGIVHIPGQARNFGDRDRILKFKNSVSVPKIRSSINRLLNQHQALPRGSGFHIGSNALHQLLKSHRIDREDRSLFACCGPQLVPAVLRVSVNVQIHAYLDFWNNCG